MIDKVIKSFDSYSLYARVCPAFITISPIIIAFTGYGIISIGWLKTIAFSGGIGSILTIALANLTRSFGKKFEEKLWDKHGGVPTTRKLRIDDKTASKAQKQIWYKALKKLTKIDIPSAVAEEGKGQEDVIIEDAIRQIRNDIRGSSKAKMVNLHNKEYGFARNWAGMRWFFLSASILSFLASYIGSLYVDLSFAQLVVSGIILIAALFSTISLPYYVVGCGERYSESMLSLVAKLGNEKPSRR